MSGSVKARGSNLSVLVLSDSFSKRTDLTQIQGEMADYGGVMEVMSSKGSQIPASV